MNSTLRAALKNLASLKLTVVLFACSMVLILAGTWAQREMGIWTAMEAYFRCWVSRVWILPFPGGFTIGLLLLINLTSALATRFRLSWKYSGLWILHGGMIFLLAGEAITALYAVEGNMTIEEGQSVSYITHDRKMELALVDPSDPDVDRVVVVPESILRGTTDPIQDPLLPVEVQVQSWMNNSRMLRASDAGPSAGPRGVVGLGRDWVAHPVDPTSGVGDQGRDVPSAYVTLSQGGQELGTWLVSLWFSAPQMVEVAGQRYELSLRSKRTYKHYSLHLIDFSHDKFTGTETPRNFSSLVRLVDEPHGEDREVLIWMNHPLRHDGETFYQASFLRGDTGTVLQVVNNPGWLVPYISSAVITLGLLIHLILVLRRFQERQKKATKEVSEKLHPTPLPTGVRFLPPVVAGGLVLLLVAVGAWAALRPVEPVGGFDLDSFGRLPVSSEGRIKPLDTFARTSLMLLNDKRSYRVDGEKRTAVEWLLECAADPEAARTRRVFRIDDPGVISMLGLDPDAGPRYSHAEIMADTEELSQQIDRAWRVQPNERTPFQKHVVELSHQLGRYAEVSSLERPYLIPPPPGGGEWSTLQETVHSDPSNAALVHWSTMLRTRAAGDAAGFNEEVEGLTALIASSLPQEIKRSGLEIFFNRFQPFLWAMGLYVLLVLLALTTFLLRCYRSPAVADGFWRGTMVVLIMTLVIHSLGLGMRIYITDRPPVTNLYTTAVFVGWACTAFGVYLEYQFRLSLAGLMASVIGVLTLIIAVNIAEGDTMNMMQAVLDSNFWLSTHVITITLGYSATFVAGIIAIYYVITGLLTTTLDGESRKSMYKMVYGAVCTALLLSFVGTVLGGIWADQSWGRFWGWDPKENGALLIVLWNAIMLHSRMGGLVRERGFMILAILGNIVTLWSWFGVNQLGVGLHSYGFMSSAVFWLGIAALAHILIGGVGLIPTRLWRSVSAEKQRAQSGDPDNWPY